MTLSQWVGVWLLASAFLLAGLTVGVVTIGLYMVAVKQDERRYGVRRRKASAAGDRRTDRETLARVGWVGIEKVEK